MPEKSAAPNSASKILKVNTSSTVNGIASISVGTSETRATNHDCSRNSRHANGRRGIDINVSNDSAKNPPTARNGFDTVLEAVIPRP